MLEDFGIVQEGVRGEGRISKNGAVLLGENFVCDAHFDRPVRIVTHAHSDHIRDLNKSRKECRKVIMSKETRNLLRALYGRKFGELDDVETLRYGETFEQGGEKLTLFKANHILGSAQVLVEAQGGDRILYTGDFKLPDTPVVPSDLLVLEATYGKPSQIRPFKGEINPIFGDFVRMVLRKSSINIFGYHGKLQESLRILRGEGIKNPAVMRRRVYEVAKIYEREGENLGRFFEWNEAEDILREGRYIGLFHSRDRSFGRDSINVKLSGWEFEKPIRYYGGGNYVVALSDHSDFEQLMEYTGKSDPDFVITDDSRVGDAVSLAKEIEKRFGKPAGSMP